MAKICFIPPYEYESFNFYTKNLKMNYLSLQNLPFETERLEHPFTKMFDKERPKQAYQ